MGTFNHDLFTKKIKLNHNISNVDKIDVNNYKITCADHFEFFVIINSEDSYHKFTTTLPLEHFNKYFYHDCMYHDTYDDLYFEINRMSNKTTRDKLPKYPLFKSY